MHLLKRLARRYPMQTFLFLFNAGVFTWLQTTGTMIAHRLGLSGDGIWLYIPDWLKIVTRHSMESIQTLRYLGLDLVDYFHASNLACDLS